MEYHIAVIFPDFVGVDSSYRTFKEAYEIAEEMNNQVKSAKKEFPAFYVTTVNPLKNKKFAEEVRKAFIYWED